MSTRGDHWEEAVAACPKGLACTWTIIQVCGLRPREPEYHGPGIVASAWRQALMLVTQQTRVTDLDGQGQDFRNYGN